MTSEPAAGNAMERVTIMAPLLERWAQQRFGASVDVDEVVRFPGHSGITFSFAVRRGGELVERLVIKVPPLGVPQRDNTDVLRQVPVLRLMAREGIRVPAVRSWGTASDGPFPVPHVIVEHVAGSTPGDVFVGPLRFDRAEARPLFEQAVAELAAIHAVPWTVELSAWSAVRGLRDEIDHWVPVLRKAQDPSWVSGGMAVRDALLRTMPEDERTGVVHGDYYSNNWLFEDGDLTAVLDWENSSLGPQLIDVGWLCMIYDQDSWGPTRRAWMGAAPSPEWFLSRYQAHSGQPITDAAWYRALAGYRLACLTAYYVRLHRTGRRVDPVWELFAEAFPHLLGRAEELLAGA